MAPRPLIAGFVLFLAVITYLVSASLLRRSLPVFDPTPADRPAGVAFASETDTFTVDTTDPNRWRYFSFARRGLVEVRPTPARVALNDGAPGSSLEEWDVAFRRYHVVPAVAAADLGAIPLDSAARLTVRPDAWLASAFGRDTANAATARWYRYSFVTHLLESRGHVYAVRARDGREVRMEVLSYYCPGMRAGCLTVRYK